MSRESAVEDDETDPEFDFGFTRRTFLQASGAAAGAGLLGTGAGPVGARETIDEDDGFDGDYANWRVREARKVWDRGFRGRQDRPIALTDSGLDALHPDLGPWNGVRVEDTKESFQLVEDTFERIESADVDETRPLPEGSATRAEVADIPVPEDADRIRIGAVDAGLEENGILYIEDAEGSELDSNDGLLADYIGVATPVAKSQTETVTVAVESTTSTGTQVDFHVRFYENAVEGGGQETTTLKPIKGEKGTQTESGTIGPSVTGPAAENVRIDLKQPQNAAEVQATLSFSPQPQDLDFELQNKETGRTVASSANAPGSGESFTAAVDGSTNYEMVISGFAVAQADYEVVAEFSKEVPLEDSAGGPNRARKVLPNLESATDKDDKTLAWYGTKRYGEFAKARDGNGHGTHCSSIMGGSGRASAVEDVTEKEPHAVLGPTDSITYTVDAAAGTGVFASAFGDGLDIVIEDPEGEAIAQSQLLGGGPHSYDASIQDTAIAVAPTTHGPNDPEAENPPRATYKIHVSASQENTTGTPLAAQLERIAFGSFLDPEDTDGDREDDGAPDTVQAGVAPDAGLVGVQGLGGGLAALAKDPDFWTENLSVRSVNMSWGLVGGAPFGAAGGEANGAVFGGNENALVKTMAEGGLLTVAAAGNSYTPANGNSVPAVADEAVSVASTGPLDGLSAFSSGGAGAVDEDNADTEDDDDSDTHTKPDVTAPGGRAPVYPASLAFPVYDDIVAAKNGIPEVDDERRAYTGKIGTSMASPFVNGVAGLLANAMEFGPSDEGADDRPDALTLPEPSETDIADVRRWKSLLLATASETCFTAAPYHEAKTVPHAPTYEHGGRDPYEGYGRVNPDAAIDAVTRELVPDESIAGEVGLNLPEDSRAVAGYVDPDGCSYTVEVSYDGLVGANAGMAKGPAHIDLFVYDPANPGPSGDPTIVASDQGVQGDASVTFDAAGEDDEAYVVVAKLVNVPGVVNGFDVQAHFDLRVSKS